MSSSFLSNSKRRSRRLPVSFFRKRRKEKFKHAGSSRQKMSLTAAVGGGATRKKSRKASVEWRIKKFVEWCDQVGIELHPHVCITDDGMCDGIGVRATADITEGECVATIPRAALISCSNDSSVADLVAADDSLNQDSTSSWVPLLVCLAAEYSKKYSSNIFSRSTSKWDAYLSLVPSESNPPPMMWEESVRQRLLEGTSVNQWVYGDLEQMQEDFESLALPFMRKNRGVFKKIVRNCEMFKKLSAFVMAYSFTDEEADHLGRTMMVPFVDLLNHSSKHHVELVFQPSCLQLLAVTNIRKGEEVMNTYGQLSNASLLHKYGFTEQDNPHEEAIVPCELVREVYLEMYPSSTCHWDSLCSQDMVEEEYSVDANGVPEHDLLGVVRLLSSLVGTAGQELPQACPQLTSLKQCLHHELTLLKKLARRCLDAFPEEVTSLTPVSCFPVSMSLEEKHSLQLVLGQQNALRKLLDASSLAMD